MEINLLACGQRIYHIRKKHHCSMARFAKLLGDTSASTINNWEKGNNLPKAARLEQIALLGNTTINWLLYGEFTSYVADLLDSLTPEQPLTKNQLAQLCTQLAQKKISYTEDLAILSVARELFPKNFLTNYPNSATTANEQSLVAESFTLYEVETQIAYRTRLLPLLERCLLDSATEKTHTDLIEQFLLFITSYELEAWTYATLSKLIALLTSSDFLTTKNQPTNLVPSIQNPKQLNKKEQWDELFTRLFEECPS